MARKSIPDKHAPENISSPNANGRPVSQSVPGSQFYRGPMRLVNEANRPESDPSYVPATAPTGPDSFQDILSLFTEDPSRWDWQPSETVVGSHDEAFGLPPWEPFGSEQQLDAWGSVLPSAW